MTLETKDRQKNAAIIRDFLARKLPKQARAA
jgi:hypothetical protein